MARFETNGIDEIEKELKRLENIDPIAQKMVNAAAPIVEDNLKKNIRQAANRRSPAGKKYSVGALERSIRATKAKVNAYGCFSVVRPTGVDAKGVRNAEKMAYLEYGTSKGQEARPVMVKTMNESASECLTVMQEVFNAETEK